MEEKQQDPNTQQDNQQENIPKFRGLYRYVHISVRALDTIIIACIAVILIVTFASLQKPGYNISFDSKGGTDVQTVRYQYGDQIQPPEPPTREGYTFSGWYQDPGYSDPWEFDTETVEGSMTLYAQWTKK